MFDGRGGICNAVRREVEHRRAAYNGAAAAHDDGGVFEQVLKQVGPHVLLRLVVQGRYWVV